jgi:DNA-binding NarL/FixJ family response regulator
VEDDIKSCQPDVVLMDLEMPVQNGIYGISRIKALKPAIRIIVQTAYDDDDRVFAALRAGAEGYILKSAPVSKILQSIDDVLKGGSSMSPSIAAKVLRYFEQSPVSVIPSSSTAEKKVYSLSAKELEVLKRLKSGMTYKQIADDLAISYFTVNNHIKKIYEKLQVHSLGEAIGIAYKEGLV